MKKSFFLAVTAMVMLFPSLLQAHGAGNSVLRNKILTFAEGFIGVPYVYGSANPQGFDCTGLIFYTYEKVASMTIPRATRFLAQFGKKVTLEQALPGDVLIFDTIGGPSHAGLYMGNNQVLHAASAGTKTGVIISSMKETYYASRFLYARQILPVQGETVEHPTSPEAPNLPLTTLDVPVGRRSLRNYDSIPCLSGTLVEFEVQQNRQEKEPLIIMMVKGDWEEGSSQVVWKERVNLSPGETYRTRQTLLEEVSPWSLVVQTPEGVERALRTFRTQKG